MKLAEIIENAKNEGRKEVLKIMENWKFQEIERAKLEEDEDKSRRREADEERIQEKL